GSGRPGWQPPEWRAWDVDAPQGASLRSFGQQLRPQSAQVVPLATAGVHDDAVTMVRQLRDDKRCDAIRERLRVRCLEELAPARDHLLAVTRVLRVPVLSQQKVDVSLSGDIKRMIVRAAVCPFELTEGLTQTGQANIESVALTDGVLAISTTHAT